MKEPALRETRELVRRACELYDGQPAADTLAGYEQRLHGPLRLAVAGMIKAGKSTLLNALVGEVIAATDAGECTRIITWYRYSATPTMTLHPHDGPPERLPFRREDGQVIIDLGARTADEVAWIDVGWPAESLREAILIDTPGIASLSTTVSERTTGFLTGEQTVSAADAVVYLMRHMHGSDLQFLEAFRGDRDAAPLSVNAVAVLSRADEIGSARIDSLLSAATVARRYATEPQLRPVVLDVLPVAGLLAEAARTLRESEFRALAAIAALERTDRERMLVSADRFTRSDAPDGLDPVTRRALLDRFGLFGIRLSAALIRGGATGSIALSEQLVARSGLTVLQAFLRDRFHAHAATLKVHAVLPGIEAVLREHPVDGSARLLGEIERIVATTHSLREMAALARTRSEQYSLSEDDLAEAVRILGAHGDAAAARVGLAVGVDGGSVRARAQELLERWHGYAHAPLNDRPTVALCDTVARSLEQVMLSVPVGGGVDDASRDVVLPR